MTLLISDLIYLEGKWWGGVPWKECPICERMCKEGYRIKGVYPKEGTP